MKRISFTSAALASLLICAAWSWSKKDEKAPKVTAATTATAVPSASAAETSQPKGEETIVHTFANDDEVKAFANLWQQRQGIITRMAVLRAYWSEEQTRLNEMDAQLTSAYKLDLKKRHVLSPERKVLIELEPLADAPEAPGQPQPPAAQSPANTPRGS